MDLPDDAKGYLLESGEQSEAPKRSIINSLRRYRDVISTLGEKNLSVPIGVNVEQPTRSNFSSSVRMIDEFQNAIDLSGVGIGEQMRRIEYS